MAKGKIWLDRELFDHRIWVKSKPFSKGQACVDMIFMANWKDTKVPYKNKFTTIKRGAFIRSVRDLSKRWGWSDSAVHRFLVLLESDDMIVKKRDQKANFI